MKKSLGILGLGLGLFACNWDVGQCYVRGQGSDGAGGAIVTQTGGVGGFGFGHVPLQPQDATSTSDPCIQTATCTVTWKAGSDVCNAQGTTHSCTTLYQGQHRSLDEAKTQCEKILGVGAGSGVQGCDSCEWGTGPTDCKEACKEKCDRIWELCRDNCPPRDRTCFQECMSDYSRCLKDCDTRCK